MLRVATQRVDQGAHCPAMLKGSPDKVINGLRIQQWFIALDVKQVVHLRVGVCHLADPVSSGGMLSAGHDCLAAE